MLLLSWENSLKQALNRCNKQRPLRLALLGIGHELRGDDAAGLVVARQLRPFARDNFLVIEAAHAPENHTGIIRRFRPTLVLLVDAAQMNEPPSTIGWLSPQQMTGISASTHTMPPYMLTQFLQAELGCKVALIGIQPADTTLGASLSVGMETAVATIVQTLKDTLFDDTNWFRQQDSQLPQSEPLV